MAHETRRPDQEAHAVAVGYGVLASTALALRARQAERATRAAVRISDGRLYRSAGSAASPSPTVAGWQRRRVEHPRRVLGVPRLDPREPRGLVRARVAASRVGGRR